MMAFNIEFDDLIMYHRPSGSRLKCLMKLKWTKNRIQFNVNNVFVGDFWNFDTKAKIVIFGTICMYVFIFLNFGKNQMFIS